MQDMHFSTFDGKQYAIPAYDRVTYLFLKLVVFRCERECLGNDGQLLDNSGSQLTHPPLRLTLPPLSAAPFVRSPDV
jgi:hypothetical protein